MTTVKIRSPFGAPVFHEEKVSSTMDVSRELAQKGAASGTVIAADFQEEGRGRGQGRSWDMQNKMSLPFTILLKFQKIEEIPAALTLRAGLALCHAIEDFAPVMKSPVRVKWPNDIMIGSKKAAGILCEAEGGNVHIGIGVNFAQKEFTGDLQKKATSIALASGSELSHWQRFIFLEIILTHLYDELQSSKSKTWKDRLEKRLYKINEQVTFIEGSPDSGKEINGKLCGISDTGELLILSNNETTSRSFITGELRI